MRFLGASQARSVDDHHGNSSFEYHLDPVTKKFTRDRRSVPKVEKERPPEFITKPRRQFLEEGQTAKFKATFDGTPSTKLTWSKDGATIQNDRKHRIYTENGVHYLDICAVSTEDMGSYTCTIQNSAGSASAAAELEVFVKPKSLSSRKGGFLSPKVDSPLTDLCVPSGERNVQLECKFSNDYTKARSKLALATEKSDLQTEAEEENIEKKRQRRTNKRYIESDTESDEPQTPKKRKSPRKGSPKRVPPSLPPLPEWPETEPEPEPEPERRKERTENTPKRLLSVFESKSAKTPQHSNAIDATATWRRNGQKVSSSYLTKQTFDGRLARLTINRITDREAGVYECEASNSGGSAVTKATLSIAEPGARHIPPKFVNPLSDQTVEQGKQLVLESRVTGYPKPTVTWYKGREEIKSTKALRTEFDGSLAKLTMSSVQITDSDVYKCIAENDAGKDQVKASIKVKAPSDIKDDDFREPPVFTRELTDMNADEGDKVEMVVEVKGVSPIKVLWLHGDREICHSDPHFKLVMENNVHKLIISKVSVEDSGQFVCEAYNDFGDDETYCNLCVRETTKCMLQNSNTNNEYYSMKSVHQNDIEGNFQNSRSDSGFEENPGFVEKYGFVENSQHKPDFALKPCSVEVDPGLSAIFLCRPTGNPPPSVTWKKQGQIIQNDQRHRICIGEDCILEIKDITPADSGKYTCELRNSAGSVTTETNLVVRETISQLSSPSDARSLLRKSSKQESHTFSINTSSPNNRSLIEAKQNSSNQNNQNLLKTSPKWSGNHTSKSEISAKCKTPSPPQGKREETLQRHSGSVLSSRIEKFQKLEQKPPKSPGSVDYRSVLKPKSKSDHSEQNKNIPDEGARDGVRKINQRKFSSQRECSPHRDLNSNSYKFAESRTSEGDIFKARRTLKNSSPLQSIVGNTSDGQVSKVKSLREAFSKENPDSQSDLRKQTFFGQKFSKDSPVNQSNERKQRSLEHVSLRKDRDNQLKERKEDKAEMKKSASLSENSASEVHLEKEKLSQNGYHNKNDSQSSRNYVKREEISKNVNHEDTPKRCTSSPLTIDNSPNTVTQSGIPPKRDSPAIEIEFTEEEDFRALLDKRRERSPYRFKNSSQRTFEAKGPEMMEENVYSRPLENKNENSLSPKDAISITTTRQYSDKSNPILSNQKGDITESSNQSGSDSFTSSESEQSDLQEILERRRNKRTVPSSLCADHTEQVNITSYRPVRNDNTIRKDNKTLDRTENIRTYDLKGKRGSLDSSISKAADNWQTRLSEIRKNSDKDSETSRTDELTCGQEDLQSVLSKRRRHSSYSKFDKKENSPASQTDFRHVLTRHVETRNRQPPVFQTSLADQKVKEGQPVTMECLVTGIPRPEITWSMNNNTIKPSKFFRMTYKENQAKLDIEGAYPEDDGLYTCTASNSVGTEKCSCHLHVQELFTDQSEDDSIKRASTPPEVIRHHVNKSSSVTLDSEGQGQISQESDVTSVSDSEALYTSEEDMPTPRVMAPCIHEISPGNLTTCRGQKVTVRASFISPECPDVTWFRDDQKVMMGGDITVTTTEDSSQLLLPSAQRSHAGIYTVTVQNSAGSTSASATLTVEDVPDPPVSRPHASEVTLRSIIVTWSGPAYDGGSHVTGYRVEICDAEEDSWQIMTDKCHSTSYLVENLQPYHPYFFRVSARNKHGYGKPSEVSAVIVTRDPESEFMHQSMESDEEDLPFDPRVVSISQDRVFEDEYDLKEEVGKGKFGKVFKCKEKLSGQTFAAKILRCRTSREKETIRQEIQVMNQLTHPKLLMLWDAFETAKSMVLVMEYVAGGELFDRVADEDLELTEWDCVHYMRQICTGVQYMHNKNILHLDLKPENILCVHKDNNLVKIIDFGLARVHEDGESLKVLFGTPEFIAPEVVNYEEIGHFTDIWSIGVICYVLLSGLSPFMGDSDGETLANVTRGDFDYDDEAFDEISDTAKDFINQSLKMNKHKRLTIEQCLEHSWLAKADRKSSKKLRQSLRNLKQFMARRKWQKMGNAIRAVGRMSSAMLKTQKARSGSDSSVNSDTSSQTDHPVLPSRTPPRSSPWRQGMNSDLKQIDGESEDRTSSTNTHNSNNIKQNGDVHHSIPSDRSDRSSSEHSSDSLMSRSSGSRTKPKIAFEKEMVDCEAFIGDIVRFDVKISCDSSVKLVSEKDETKRFDNLDPKMEWFFEDTLIVQDAQHSFVNSLPENGECSLIIKNVNENNEGEYLCKCTSDNDELSCCAELSVYGGATM